MSNISNLHTQYKNFTLDEKRLMLIDLLGGLLDKGDNFVVIHRYISEFPDTVEEKFLDEICETIIETIEKSYEKDEQYNHNRIIEITKKIQLLEQEEWDSFNGDEILAEI